MRYLTLKARYAKEMLSFFYLRHFCGVLLKHRVSRVTLKLQRLLPDLIRFYEIIIRNYEISIRFYKIIIRNYTNQYFVNFFSK
jgi:hypothetical protein